MDDKDKEDLGRDLMYVVDHLEIEIEAMRRALNAKIIDRNRVEKSRYAILGWPTPEPMRLIF